MMNICENCSGEYSEDAQLCEKCGMDGLCPGCIGDLDHECEEEEK